MRMRIYRRIMTDQCIIRNRAATGLRAMMLAAVAQPARHAIYRASLSARLSSLRIFPAQTQRCSKTLKSRAYATSQAG